MAGINTSIGGFDLEQVDSLPEIERATSNRGPSINSSVELLGFLKAFPKTLFRVSNDAKPNTDLDGLVATRRNGEYYVSYEPDADEQVGVDYEGKPKL